MLKAGVKLQCQACQTMFAISDIHECSCGEWLCPNCHGVTGLTGSIKRKKPVGTKSVSEVVRTETPTNLGLSA